MRIAKIVSGGQTGADTGGLDAAIWCEVPHGGWCPKGRLCEEGEISPQYLLAEMTTKEYLKRTEANVVDSDITLVFTHGEPTGGSKRTIELAEKHGRPVFNIDPGRKTRQSIPELGALLLGNEKDQANLPKECIINIAGSRESGTPGIAREVMVWVIELIDFVNQTTHYPPGDTGNHRDHIIHDERTGT